MSRVAVVTGAAGGLGRAFVDRLRADGLEEKLRDPGLQGVVRIRLRDDGHVTPLSIRFRPRPAEVPPVSLPQ